MAADRVRDGHRIAELLASELESGETHDALAVTDADPEVTPTPDGALAYRVLDRRSEEVIAEVFVQPDRAYVEFRVAPETAASAAEEAGLRVRPKAVQPPQTVVFVEDGAQVKWVLGAFTAVIDPAPDGG
ncbi:hypothetical protein [Halolamina sp.]|jgi:hypothetical protein|uniref:hypothetical protein n=1 Tax=Halolamina sp. TaxID=1940283 RepID=UPI000223B6E4|nr:hypothetical protein Halar_1878 [halophilic archaeon DL31]